jgi:predicted dehydrogenase
MRLKFVIIGCGKIAERHAAHISKRGVLVAVCDVVKEKADGLASKYGAKAYYSIKDLLDADECIDIAAVCTPNGLHAAHTIQCLNAGLHVLCEKPMALRVEDCRGMIDAAKSSGKVLAVVKQNRFNPPVVAVKELLDKRALGKIYSIQVNCYWNREADYYTSSNWRGTKELDGGILFTQFSHFIDIMYWFAGEVETTIAYLSNYHHQYIQFEDSGNTIIKFRNGVTGSINFTINSYGKNVEGSVTIIAEKGCVKIGGPYLNTIEFQNLAERQVIELTKEGIQANDYGTYQGSMSNHDKVYDNLLKVLMDQDQLSASAEDGLKTVEIIEKIYQSAVWMGRSFKQ